MASLNSLISNHQKEKTGGFGITMVHYSKLIPSEANNYSTDNIKELARAILLSGGVKQNLLARKKSPDEYELIAGHRRRLAVKYLVEEMGMEIYAMVPVHVEKDGDVLSEINLILANCSTRERSDWEKMMEVSRLTELIKALQSGTEEEQERFRKLFGKEPDIGGRELRKVVAESLGLSETKVANLRHINSGLVPELRDKFQSGEIGVSVANEAAGLPVEEQMELAQKEKIQLADVKKKSVSESDTGNIKREDGTNECTEPGDKQEESFPDDAIGEVARVEALSAHGTPRKVYPEDSLIASAGCESEPGGFKGGYNCFGCARECEIRQKDCYCAEAPLGKPFPCEMVKNMAMLRENVGDGCQFVNLDLAYHRQGDGEPVPCCKDCDDPCELRCSRVKGIIPVPEPEPDPAQEEPSDLDRISTPMEIKDYDRDSLMQMISNAEYEMKIMGDYWKENMPGEYTKKAMEIQAYKSLLAEHDAAEDAEPGLVENPDPGQPELPVLKNNDQRKEWLRNYKAWGLWYRDGYIDVNYYKFDFEDGSRLVAAEFPQRENSWGDEKYDQVYYHLIEHGRRKYKSDKMYEDKYQYHSTGETELIEYLKKLQQKRKG